MQFDLEKLTMGLLVAVVLVIGFNTFQMSQLKINTSPIAGNAVAGSKPTANIVGNIGFELDIIPKGVPAIYGKELGVGYDDVSPSNQQKADSTIRKLGTLDQQITLGGKDMERYIGIASQISCEYCCGVEAIIFSNGEPACSCQHSFAMRGLAKYLIKYHGSEYSNEEVLEELGKWKTLFFPAPIGKKASILKGRGVELNYINLASNKYRGVENGN